ncbi:GIY-YIG nuclease family protein [Xanthobacter autotrophicus]|uniref:GIY-YIG nuclease family protein n=1 Tax=Xanthobacter autotrophicus TaxID=280 RepID=UPI00372A0D53
MAGDVYFAALSNGAIKIGYTTDLARRMSNLWYAVPGGVTVLATLVGTPDAEQWLHLKFSHLKISGEWFRPDPSLMSFIEEVKRRGNETVPEAFRADDIEPCAKKRSDPDVDARVAFWLRKLSEPIHPTDNMKARIARSADAAGMIYSRAYEIWYGRAVVTAAEYARLQDLYSAKIASDALFIKRFNEICGEA